MSNERTDPLRFVDQLCFITSTAILTGIGVWSVVGNMVNFTLPPWLAKWVLPALTAAAVGYLTNYLAITLLFRPYRPVKWLHGLQGIVPREQESLAKRLGEEIPASLLPPEKLADQISRSVSGYLSDPALADSIRQRVRFYVKHRKEQIAAQLTPYLVGAIRSGIELFFTPERIRSAYGGYGSKLLRERIADPALAKNILAELQNRVPEITAMIRRFVRTGAENYVQNEYPQLSHWIHADRFAAQMVMRLNWELIQGKISESLEEPSARGMVRGELSAMEEKLKTYVFSPEMESDLAEVKRIYMNKIISACETELAKKLPELLESVLEMEEVWRVVREEVLPAVKGFLLHQIKRNRDAIAAGLDLKGRIEKAIRDQSPEDIHTLVNRVSGEHLVALQLLGFLLGGIAGILLSFSQ